MRQRNTLLRQEGRGADRDTLEVWDARVSEAGARVYHQRLRVVEDLDPHLAEAYRLVGSTGNLTWEYTTNWGAEPAAEVAETATQLETALGARRERDMDQRVTTAGPHRDDPGLLLDGRSTRSMASQGEQRTVALALRVGAFRLIAQQMGTQPILLLDDVFSELDPQRAKGVLGILEAPHSRGQVFVTTARDDDLPVEGRRWSVQDGTVQPS